MEYRDQGKWPNTREFFITLFTEIVISQVKKEDFFKRPREIFMLLLFPTCEKTNFYGQ